MFTRFFMIPEFPNFTKIDIENKNLIETFTHKFEPYSDLNFVSLYAWDVEEKRMVAKFDEGLAILMTDYETGEPLLSFLGKFSSNTSIERLIEYVEKSNFGNTLHYIGESFLDNIDQGKFLIEDDVNNFDYIIPIADVASMKGRRFSSKRHLANKFELGYSNVKFDCFQLESKHFNSYIEPVLKTEEAPDSHEHVAIKRLVKNISDKNLLLSTVLVGDQLAGFSIDEILPNNYAISHFFKCTYTFKGIAEFMNREVAKQLMSKGAEFWNWEQDLGIKKLKTMKNGYRPLKLLKKYKISLQ